jgi:predicted nucleotidyltransferase
MPTLHNDFADFLRLLNERNVRYLVVGGYAVAYHGYPRYTGDLDVFVEASPENAARLVEVYGEFGFNRSDLKPELFMIPDNVVRIGHEPVRLEVLTSITGVAFADAYVRRIQVEVNGIVVPFIALVDLLKNKTSTGRGKDRTLRARGWAVLRIWGHELNPAHTPASSPASAAPGLKPGLRFGAEPDTFSTCSTGPNALPWSGFPGKSAVSGCSKTRAFP